MQFFVATRKTYITTGIQKANAIKSKSREISTQQRDLLEISRLSVAANLLPIAPAVLPHANSINIFATTAVTQPVYAMSLQYDQELLAIQVAVVCSSTVLSFMRHHVGTQSCVRCTKMAFNLFSS